MPKYTKLEDALLIAVIVLLICASLTSLAIAREVFIHGFH